MSKCSGRSFTTNTQLLSDNNGINIISILNSILFFIAHKDVFRCKLLFMKIKRYIFILWSRSMLLLRQIKFYILAFRSTSYSLKLFVIYSMDLFIKIKFISYFIVTSYRLYAFVLSIQIFEILIPLSAY